MDMEKHVTFVAVLNIGLGIFGLIVSLIIFVAVVGGGLLSGDPEAITITSIVGTVISGFIFLLSIPGIIGGIGLIKRWAWARVFMLIIAVLDLFNIPIGTAIGAYTLWVLLQDETIKLFKTNSGQISNINPPGRENPI